MWSLGPQCWGEGRCWYLLPSHPSRKVVCCRELLAATSRGSQTAPARCCWSLPAWHPCLFPLCSHQVSLPLCWSRSIFLPWRFATQISCLFSLLNAQFLMPRPRKRLKSPSLCLLLEGWVSQGMSQLTGRDGCDGELVPWACGRVTRAECPSLRPLLWVPPQTPSEEVWVSSGKCPCLEVWLKIATAAVGGGLGGISFWGTEWPEEAKEL